MREKKRRLNKSNKHSLKLITVVVLVLFGVLTYKSIALKQQVAAYEKTMDQYKKDIKGLKQDRKDIEDLKDYVETDSYVEEMAREKLGLVYKDEVIFEADEEK